MATTTSILPQTATSLWSRTLPNSFSTRRRRKPIPTSLGGEVPPLPANSASAAARTAAKTTSDGGAPQISLALALDHALTDLLDTTSSTSPLYTPPHSAPSPTFPLSASPTALDLSDSEDRNQIYPTSPPPPRRSRPRALSAPRRSTHNSASLGRTSTLDHHHHHHSHHHYDDPVPRRHYKKAAARILAGHRAPPHPPAYPPPGRMASSSVDTGPGAPTSILGPPLSSTPPNDLGPIDIRDALTKCEDASLSWSLQFWVTIADPLTQHVFFACPATGQCSWEPPVGAFVVPRSTDGEWWELADATRENQSYYYNTLTGVTQWDRPDGEAFVIPLGLIQRHALPAHGSNSNSSTSSPEKPNGTSVDSISSGGVRFAHPSTAHQYAPFPDMREEPPLGQAQSHSATASSSGPLTPIPDASPPAVNTVDPSLAPQGGAPTEAPTMSWWERRKSRTRLLSSPGKSARGDKRSLDISPVLPNVEKFASNSNPGSPVLDEHLAAFNMNNSAVNLVLQPNSPTSAAYENNNFSTDNFADRYFATKRSGMLRQRMSLERIMEWQRNAITGPLLVLTKASVNDAMTTFKVIQHVMGERDRAVEGARPPSHMPTASVLSLGRTREETGKDEKTVILEEIRWMIQLGVGRVEMRDELYCQLIKQLTRNPDKDATVLGFQLFCVFVAAFGPSKSFEPFVRAFLVGKLERTDFGIGVMSKYCLSRLDTLMQKGSRGRVLTIAEIEHASDAAFYPSVYGQTLETIMQRQEGAYPELRIPIVLPFLADGILALGGTESEGIFRVPGDNDVISHLKARIDRGYYQLSGVDDPHVTASLFKLWLRELEEPLVPSNMYDAALEASKDVDHTIIFIKKLPDHNRRVLLFVISFMQLFLDPEVIAVTKMTPQNLALVLAPNILRTPSESLATVFANSSFESQFVLNLLQHLDPPTVDPEYVPQHGAVGRASMDSEVSI